jgi:AbrB family looped-hinge helix DNA binding protein
MDATIQISKRGTITLPAELRKKYGIRPGDTLRLVDLDGVLVLTPVDAAESNTPSFPEEPPTTDQDELTRLGKEIGRGWRSPLTSTELLSEMRR